MKRFVIFMMVMMSFINSYGQSDYHKMKNSNLYCFDLSLAEEMFLDSFGIVYCSPFNRMVVQDTSHNSYKFDRIHKNYELFVSENNDDSFTVIPDPSRILQTEIEFINSELFLDEFINKYFDLNHSFFVLGKKEYFLNNKTIKSVLIVEKSYLGIQISPVIYIRLNTGHLVSWSRYSENINYLKKKGLL